MLKTKNVLDLTSLLTIAVFAATVSSAQAAPVAALTSFTSGTPAKASEVNANFTALKTAADANDTRIAALETQLAKELGYAHINVSGGVGSVGTSGGTGTTSVTVAQAAGTGNYSVTFNGVYPSTTTASKVVLLCTAASLQYGVCNSNVTSATPTQVVVNVWTWASTAQTPLDNSFDVLIRLGN